MTRNIAAMTHAPLGMRTVRRTSEESGLVTSLEGEGDKGDGVTKYKLKGGEVNKRPHWAFALYNASR